MMNYNKIISDVILITFIALILCTKGFSQTISKKRFEAKRITNAPVIDGILDDDTWTSSHWGGNFIQHFPNDGILPSQVTEFSICFDDDHLYIAVKAYDTSPDSIERRVTKRDELDGDYIGIGLDTYHDLNTGFLFKVSTAGVKEDAALSYNGNMYDPSWNPIWYAKTSLQSWGWAVEMKIPFTQLRFKKESDGIWGLNISRSIFRNDEFIYWQHIPLNSSGIIHLYGELSGLEMIKPKKQLDLIPYASGGIETYEKEPDNPYAKGLDFIPNAGLDAKIGVTNNFTLDVTVNPDFGQVEADPSEVNLTAFETFFEEKRPFFVEGQNITTFPLGTDYDNMFYSRRIGAKPHGNPNLQDGEYAKIPRNTKILGAAKLSGKTENGLSIGIIESFTNNEKAKISLNGNERKEMVEPFVNYFIGSIKKDFNKGNTILEGIVTNTTRSLEGDSLLLLPSSASTSGVGFTQFFNNRNWIFNTAAFFSHISGSEAAILKKQMASSRYYQRPDADHLSIDSSSTSLSGNSGSIYLGKVGGNLTFESFTAWKTPGLELNDVGYLNKTDIIEQIVISGYKFNKPFGVYRFLRFRAFGIMQWDFSGKYLGWAAFISSNSQFKNFWSFNIKATVHGEKLSTDHLRGSYAFILPGYTKLNYDLYTNDRNKFVIGINNEHRWGKENSSYRNKLELIMSYQPFNSLKFDLNPFIDMYRKDYQYVTANIYNNEGRDILGNIDQNIFGFSFRAEYNITPDFSIQYWGQPFLASGNYSKFRYITNPTANVYTDRFNIYSTDQITYDDDFNIYIIDENQDGTDDYSIYNPNFNVNEFLSNMVLRWEYRPGSTIHAVWSQTRDYFNIYGDFDINSGLNNLFTAHKPYNVFMIKLTHRFSLN